MAIRFRKTIKLAPGVRLNISKSGISTSVGTKGASVNVGKRGARATAGIPGTGISYQTKLDGVKKGKKATNHDEESRGLIGNLLSFVVTIAVVIVAIRLLG